MARLIILSKNPKKGIDKVDEDDGLFFHLLDSEVDELHRALLNKDVQNTAEELLDILQYCINKLYRMQENGLINVNREFDRHYLKLVQRGWVYSRRLELREVPDAITFKTPKNYFGVMPIGKLMKEVVALDGKYFRNFILEDWRNDNGENCALQGRKDNTDNNDTSSNSSMGEHSEATDNSSSNTDRNTGNSRTDTEDTDIPEEDL